MESAIKNFENALRISKDRGDKRQETEAYFGLADGYRQSGQTQTATEYYEIASNKAKERGDKRQEADAYLWLGHLNKFGNQDKSAMKFYEKALGLAKEQNDKRQETEALLGIADVKKISKNEELSQGKFSLLFCHIMFLLRSCMKCSICNDERYIADVWCYFCMHMHLRFRGYRGSG